MRYILPILFCLLSFQPAFSQNIYQTRDLESLNSSAVYSICQDKYGAMWFNTSTGVFRYNGKDLELLHSPLIMRHFAPGNNKIYAPTSRNILYFDVNTVKHSSIPLPTEMRFDNSAFATKGDSLFVSVGKELFLWDGAKFSECCRLESDISSMCYSNGLLYTGTTRGELFVLNETFIPEKIIVFSSEITGIGIHADGNILVGLYSGGFSILDAASCSKVASAGEELCNIRSFSSLENNVIYLGSVSGAFRYSIAEGTLEAVNLAGETSLPVCSVYLDADRNLWAGTYYNGIFYSDASFPFRVFPIPSEVKAIKSLLEDNLGRLWVVTDNYGIYCKPSPREKWFRVGNSTGIKFQGADYDALTNSLWMGEYQGDLVRLDLGRLKFKRYRIPSSESIVSVRRKGEDLYAAGSKGIFKFNPDREKNVSRLLNDSPSMVSRLEFDRDSNLVIAGTGLKLYLRDSIRTVYPNGLCTDVKIGHDGTIWAAFIGKGLARYKDGLLEWIDSPSHFIARSGVSGICIVNDDCLLLCSRNCISLFRPSDRSIVTYSGKNGLWNIASSVKSTLTCHNGMILVSGFNGIVCMNSKTGFRKANSRGVSLDNFYVNGQSRRELMRSGKAIILEPGEKNFRFSLADYDYSHSGDKLVRWRLLGYDPQWKTVPEGFSLDFMNMHHGKYTLEVETLSGLSSESMTVPLRLKPYWYQTLLVRILFVLLGILVTVIVLYSGWSKAVLSEKLRLREQENEDRIKFFRDLSLELRTPLNLAVGQMEKFFHDHGSRTKGVEDLESVYLKAKKMQVMISEFVDQQSEASGVDYAGAHFLNAATGVVERHLFSGDLDVGVLCDELSMGKTKLTKEMRRLSGMSPREFIEDIRMKHADEMLRDGRYRVSEVSDRLGFSSPRYFLQRYKARFGHVPSKRP